jgi:hypothetical protein
MSYRITTAIKRRLATAAIRRSWLTIKAAERHLERGLRLEAWAHRLAERWGCVDDALATLTNQSLSH